MTDFTTGYVHAPTTLTIDLDALARNFTLLAKTAAPAEPSAVIKANGYGLGDEIVAKTLHAAGCRRFFTAHLDEAIRVRAALPDPAVEIGVLNGLLPGHEAAYREHSLFPTLNDLGQIDRWSVICDEYGPLPAAVHVDTGMRRLGLPPDETVVLASDPGRMRFPCRYLMSHLACADTPAHPLNREQLAAFTSAVAKIPHEKAVLANSSGVFLGPEYHFDMIRPGVSLYGGRPNTDGPNPMEQVIRLEAKILQIRHVDAPQTVGYGAAHTVEGPGRIATIGVGYADGYLRSLSGCSSASIDGIRVPLVGRVSMDLLTFDITEAPKASVGDTLVLIGPDYTIDELADDAGTIGYEVLTSLGQRYLRRYTGGAAG
ncbi:MAG: alanine racemase [Alphaproteobacteria bacterium]